MPAIAPFDEQETGIIERVPFCVFFLVAGADGKVDQREFEGFVNGLLDVGTRDDLGGPEAPTSQLLANSSRYFSVLHDDVKAFVAQGGKPAALRRIQQGCALLDGKLGSTETSAFKRAMFNLGQMVAEASGGILGMGAVSRSEREALVALGGVLGTVA